MAHAQYDENKMLQRQAIVWQQSIEGRMNEH